MIEVKNLTYTYMKDTPFEKTALKNISFGVEEGNFFAIAGHTGSGKSTLIQIIAGLIDFKIGAVEVDGESITKKSARRKIGIVFQYPEHQLFEETVESDIAFGSKNFGLNDAEVAKRVEKMGIQAWWDLDPRELLGDEADRYVKVPDTLDVWFDSGVSSEAVLSSGNYDGLEFPADLYLEGRF